MKLDIILIGAVIVIAIAAVLFIANITTCETSLRVDENGIALSDPCGQIDGMFR